MNLKNILVIGLIASSLVGFSATAEETVGEKLNTKTNQAGDKMKDGYDHTSHEICKKVNGEMDSDCVAKHAKNKAKTAKSKVGTKAQDLKNKVD